METSTVKSGNIKGGKQASGGNKVESGEGMKWKVRGGKGKKGWDGISCGN